VERWFVDAAYVVALANERDVLHTRARDLATRIKREKVELVTTQAILLEVASALSPVRSRKSAVLFVEELRDGAVVLPLTPDLLWEAWDMYKTHTDKEWTWVDTISFVAMRREGLTEALTSDHHFEQASFRALLAPDEQP